MTTIGVDVGGTFTDVVAFDEATGGITAIKVPSTSGQEDVGFLAGLQMLEENSTTAGRIVHGTTVATNALLQRKFGRVVLITTSGFRDVIEIGRSRRYRRNSLFDSLFVKSPPLVDRSLRLEVRERMGADGTVVEPLTKAELVEIRRAVEAARPDSVAVCFVNSYVNDEHERMARDWLRSELPGVHVCSSTEVHSAYQEFERFTTTALNAALIPVMARYIERIEAGLKGKNASGGLLIMGSGGGAMKPGTASRFPVRTILSGPAGGVSAACRIAVALGRPNLITYDMGGTSTDVATIRNGEPSITHEYVHGGTPIRGAMIEINTVGAGAGSIAYLDEGGELSVGPESAGAEPGPACYGNGGKHPTVTDANLVLGRLSADRPLGGHLHLDPTLANASISKLAASVGGVETEALAAGIVRLAIAKTVGAIREISIERGLDPRDFTLLAFGGAGPMHAVFVAEELGCSRVLVPPMPGNFSALGLISSDVRTEVVRTLLLRVEPDARTRLAREVGEMTESARRELLNQGFPERILEFECWADMRYTGQASSFSVCLPSTDAIPDAEEIVRLFLMRYEERYGHANPDRPIDIDTIRVVGIARTTKPPVKSAIEAREQESRPSRSRRVRFGERWVECPIHERSTLASDSTLDGPAIVEEPGSTTVVGPGWVLSVDANANVLLNRERR